MSPRFLILETSSRAGLVAISEGDVVCAERALPEARRHARDLAPAARGLLDECGWRPTDINAVAVTVGPGSYTGLRVGLMSAKAFAYVTKCEIIALETFAVIAQQIPSDHCIVEVIGDAQQDRIYRQRFKATGNGDWRSETPLEIMRFCDWLPMLDDSICVSGPGVSKFAERIPSGVAVAVEEMRTPTAKAILKMANDRNAVQQFDDVWTIEPLYLRPSAAELQWDRRETSGGGC